MCKRLKDGVDISDAKNYFEDIREVKPGGHFLSQASTIESCRSSEFIMPQLCDRNSFEQWVELGRPDLYDKAREKVEEILATPPKNPLPDTVIGKFEDITDASGSEFGRWAWSSDFLDFNLDGHLDLYVQNGFVTGARKHDL